MSVDPPPPIDARAVRAAQGVIAVATLAAFVFGLPWLVAAVFAVVAVGAVLGPRANAFLAVSRALLAGVVAERTATVEPTTRVRDLDVVAAVALGAASASFLAGIGVVAWLLTLAEAAIAAVAASTGVNLAATLLARLHQRTR